MTNVFSMKTKDIGLVWYEVGHNEVVAEYKSMFKFMMYYNPRL